MHQIDRNNLTDAVARFLADGGEVEQVEVQEKVKKPTGAIRRSRPRASGVAETNPYDVPISLAERQYEHQARHCEARGLTLLQTIRNLGLSRHSVLRICKEFDLSLRKAQPETPAQYAQALREAYQRGLPHPVACNRLHLDPELGRSHYADCAHLLDDIPTPPAMHEGSEASLLSVILLGLDAGKSLAQIVKENQLDAAQAYHIYTKHRRLTRRLL